MCSGDSPSFCAQSLCKHESEMTNSSHAYNADLFAGTAAVAYEGAVCCEASAEHGCCFVGFEAIGNGEDPDQISVNFQNSGVGQWGIFTNAHECEHVMNIHPAKRFQSLARQHHKCPTGDDSMSHYQPCIGDN
jgi:hypothetical protein